MRETAFSSAAWEKLVKERVTANASLHLLPAGSVRLQVSKLISSVPKNRWKTRAAAPPSTLCAESWSGIGGVVTSGGPSWVDVRVRVAVGVRVLDSRDRSPVVVVVLGLERADVAVREGHVEQAEQSRLLPQVESLVGGHDPRDPGHCSGELSTQNSAISVWSGVRSLGVVVPFPPSLFTSSKSAV
jgi:hypothetical protein